MNNNFQSESELAKDQRCSIVKKYIELKVAQIQSKLGIAVEKASQEASSNYVILYMKTLASERVATITKSLANSFKFYLKALLKDQDVEFCKRYHQLLFREINFYLLLVQLNDTWSMATLVPYLLNILVGVSTVMLNPPKGHEIAYATLCSLLISAISTERQVCVSMNNELTEEYAAYVFEGFSGTYADYLIKCCKDILFGNAICKPFDALISFSLYNILPYVFRAQINTGKDLCLTLVKMGLELEEQRYSLQALSLLSHGIRLSILSNMDDSVWILGNLLADPSAFETLEIMLETKDKEGTKLEKLRNCSKKSLPEEKVEELKKFDESSLFKTVPEKSVILYLSEQDGTNIKVEVDLLDKKGELRKEPLTGAEGIKDSLLMKTLKELILPQYYKWKELRAPDTKQYNIRTVCEYLGQKSVVGLFELPEIMSVECECGHEMMTWARGVINEVVTKGHVKEDVILTK